MYIAELALWRFVASEVLLSLGKDNVLAEFWAVLAQCQFFCGILRVFRRVINTFARFFAHKTYNFSFVTFFSHGISPLILKISYL